MKIFIRFIVNIVIGYLKRVWYFVKVNKLKEELENEKKQSKQAVDEANDAVDDFERAMRMYRDSAEKESRDNDATGNRCNDEKPGDDKV